MSGLWAWLRGRWATARPVAPPSPLPRPDPPVCVIGDLHGRADLLELMLTRIADEPEHAIARLIFVGDMIDRGPDSAAVLRRLYALNQAAPARVICLMGNHERMMLDFLTDPNRHGPRWIAAGGAETLISFGLTPYGRTPMPDLATALRAALTADLVEWLAGLPLLWHEGLLAVTHAGADPGLSLEAQTPERLLWGTRRPESSPRQDGIWVAEGHRIVDIANSTGARISVDTGAWKNGRLSAAWIDQKSLIFISVSD